MLTLFSIPKPFEGRSAWIQRNAIRSWIELDDDVEVILFGDDPGVADAARGLGVDHVPSVTRTRHGTPLLDGVFAEARTRARHRLLCFANTDIILLDDFLSAARRLEPQTGSWLAVGESWDTPIEAPIDFDSTWEAFVRERARSGRRRGAGALDYFLFTRDLYEDLPPFAVGRVGFDNWLVWRAGDVGARVIDITPVVRAVHQRHDYSHLEGGRAATRYDSPEGMLNIQLLGSKSRVHTRYDATHILRRRGLRPNLLRTFRIKENARKAVYKARTHTPWPPSDWK